ncbi:hypothetical protein T261_7886 [Streptomyces lydicus]|nr:hypothetical protein T261_7886 [Streptomyces lydicus]
MRTSLSPRGFIPLLFRRSAAAIRPPGDLSPMRLTAAVHPWRGKPTSVHDPHRSSGPADPLPSVARVRCLVPDGLWEWFRRVVPAASVRPQGGGCGGPGSARRADHSGQPLVVPIDRPAGSVALFAGVGRVESPGRSQHVRTPSARRVHAVARRAGRGGRGLRLATWARRSGRRVHVLHCGVGAASSRRCPCRCAGRSSWALHA